MKMKVKVAASVIAVLVIAMVAASAFLFVSGNAPQTGGQRYYQSTTTPPSQGSPSSTTAANQSQIKLSGSQYAPYAYLISTSNISQSARQALSGFNRTRTVLANGSIEIQIVPYGTSNAVAAFNISASDSLYYIEGSFGDDAPPSGEYSLSDDGMVLTNSTGYIIKP